MSFGYRTWQCVGTFDERNDITLLNRIFDNFQAFWWLDYLLDRLGMIPRWRWHCEHVLDVRVKSFVSQRDLSVFVLAIGQKIFRSQFWRVALLHALLTQNASSRPWQSFFFKDLVCRNQVSWCVLRGACRFGSDIRNVLPFAQYFQSLRFFFLGLIERTKYIN